MNEQSSSRSRIRWLTGGLALACSVGGIHLSMQFPLAQPLAPALLVALIVAFMAGPHYWLIALPALLPVVGFAPWTGWLTFEEFDVLVLAAASAGYLRYTYRRPLQHAGRSVVAPLGASGMLTIALFVLTTIAAMFLGFADAGGYGFGWFHGYHEPMNSIRLAKSFLAAVLLLPLWHWTHQTAPQRATAALSWGLISGLVAVSLATLWERVAFVGLLDFSSDYRTTGLFWEMHVGGAALDGFLALTVPFAMREFMAAKTSARWSVAASVLSLATYACLTTFSRGVYLAIPVSLICLWVLQSRQQSRTSAATTFTSPIGFAGAAQQALLRNVAVLVLLVGFGACAGWMFQTSGYRGLLALLGAMALALPLAVPLRSGGIRQVLAGLAGGITAVALAIAVAFLFPKGPYIAYTLSAGLTVVLYWAHYRKLLAALAVGPLALAGLLATLASAVLVAVHWGYSQALWPAASASGFVLLVALLGAASHRLPWPTAFRAQASLVGAMGSIAAVVGIFGGGAYMGDRFEHSNRDLENRLAHWKLGLDMLQSPADWWLGKGLGRYPANHFLVGDPKEHPGDYRLVQEAGNSYLKIAGGLHINGWSQIFRVTQRVAEPGKQVKVSAQVRTANDVTLAFEVCEKHLLYSRACMKGAYGVKAAPGKWQPLDAVLAGDTPNRGHWYAPRIITFAVAVDTRGGVADLDQIKLIGSAGQDLLENGDFSGDLAHWFSSSDKHHMPWHMKNIVLHVLFEQGILGLLFWSLLLGGAMLRLSVGRAKQHPLAPAIAAALVGFFVVGLFDSLLDVPRVAMLFYFFVLVGITLDGAPPAFVPANSIASSGLDHMYGATGKKLVKTGRLGRTSRGLAAAVFALVLLAGLSSLLAVWGGRSPASLLRITPAEWIRHAKPALAQYPSLQSALLPPLEFVQTSIERPPPAEALPSLGKGQQTQALPAQRYHPTGAPVVMQPGETQTPALATLKVSSTAEFSRAIGTASAGQVVELLPGRYRLTEGLTTGSAGTPVKPITIRANKPGEVILEFDLVQGIHVTQPYWVFENLTFRGACQRDSKCEHALHIVGSARSVVVRNNRLEDFNAHIKINGEEGKWPDHGLVQFNTFTNSRPRQTSTPVTPIDLVAASHWQVLDNVITDFASADADRVSYGVFMKGAGNDGRIERNLIVCSTKEISRPGVRVGISWGGGRTEPAHCRDGMCANEYTRGLATNNIIAHCNDAGIDVNGSRQITLRHNTLVNTAGIQVRGQADAVDIHSNLLEGRIRSSDESAVTQSNNQVLPLKRVLSAPDRLQFEHAPSGPAEVAASREVDTDFCHRARSGVTRVGANAVGAPACAGPGR